MPIQHGPAELKVLLISLELTSEGTDPETRDCPKKSRMVHHRYRNTSSVSSILDHLQWESLEYRQAKIQLTLFYKVV